MKPSDLLKRESLQIILLVIPFLVLIPLWDKFPPRVAIHWGLHGKPNGWADKSWGLLLAPLLNIGVAVVLTCFPSFDGRVRSYSPETQTSLLQVLKIIRLASTGFLAAAALLIDAVALGYKLDIILLVNLGTLLLFAILGNYLPKLRPNRFVGIRTPWTLKSPEVWMRTHRLFGRIIFIGSLALLPTCFLVPPVATTLLIIGFVTLTSLGSMIYSYACYRSRPSPG